MTRLVAITGVGPVGAIRGIVADATTWIGGPVVVLRIGAVPVEAAVRVRRSAQRLEIPGFGRPAVRRVVFETAIMRRVVGGRDDDAISEAADSSAIVGENRVRDGGVGVYSSPSASITSTPLAASTSSALERAGTERAWVFMPKKRGPSICCSFR